jgi:hypothetical protein
LWRLCISFCNSHAIMSVTLISLEYGPRHSAYRRGMRTWRSVLDKLRQRVSVLTYLHDMSDTLGAIPHFGERSRQSQKDGRLAAPLAIGTDSRLACPRTPYSGARVASTI